MAKLRTPLLAGHNAGTNYYSKKMRIADIVIDTEISKLFKINDKMLEIIYQNILTFGYDDSQPIVLQKGTATLLDGHTRLAAAQKAGLEEIPVTEKEFQDRETAMMYTFERQALRRNLTGAEVLSVASIILSHGRKKHDGKGREAELLAKRFNIGVSTLYQALSIEKYATEEVKEKVRNNDMSLKAASKTISPKNPKKADKQFEEKIIFTNTEGLPASIKFLKSAIMLCFEADQKSAAELLINHFLRKNERASFYKLLPDSMREYFSPSEETLDESSIALPV